jgi:hypothetical protein
MTSNRSVCLCTVHEHFSQDSQGHRCLLHFYALSVLKGSCGQPWTAR